MATFLHTMVRITDPERSRGFYEALGFRFSRDMDIVRDGQLEATNYDGRLGKCDRAGLRRLGHAPDERGRLVGAYGSCRPPFRDPRRVFKSECSGEVPLHDRAVGRLTESL